MNSCNAATVNLFCFFYYICTPVIVQTKKYDLLPDRTTRQPVGPKRPPVKRVPLALALLFFLYPPSFLGFLLRIRFTFVAKT